MSTPKPSLPVALVTGATGGLGCALVASLRERGHHVIAAAREPARLSPAAGVTPLQLDVTDAQQIEAALPVLRAAGVGVVINNAGLNLGEGLVACRDEHAALRELQVNFLGPMRLLRGIVPALQARGGGTIVNVLSVLALAPLPLCGSYAASKAAAHSMTQALRAELRPSNIRVVGVYPGAMDTAMAADFAGAKDSPLVVADAIVAALGNGHDEVFPGAAAGLGALWRADPKALERLLCGTPEASQ
jgi:short-subunit dehydrogenase